MSKKMKKSGLRVISALLIIFIALSLGPAPSYAHPPQKVGLAYQPETKNLNVTVSHNRYSDKHYIEKIEIGKNGQVVADQNFISQPSETFVYSLTVEAAPGDVLTARATCNRFGSKAEKITVGQ